MKNPSSPDHHKNHPAAITLLHKFLSNLPYLAMLALGFAIFLACFNTTPWRWLWAFLYVFYGFAGSLWIMLFLCPYCNFYDTRLCPCGYGRLAPKLRTRKDSLLFARQFRRHICAIVPLWFIPPVVGVVSLFKSFSLPLLVLLLVFAVNSFVILPLFSRKYGCAHCPQKQSCPWMSTHTNDPPPSR